jgi:ATP-dependent Clp protease ATP-binding subunit ClpB
MEADLNAEQRAKAIQDALRAHFRPEFLNRIDETVIFNRLEPAQIDGIVGVQLQQVIRRLADKRVELEITPEARRWVAEKGYDPVFGARPLKRVIQAEILNPLAKDLIAGRIKAGEKVKVSRTNGGLKFDSDPVM